MEIVVDQLQLEQVSSDLFRPIYSECEVLLLGIERGLLTQKELEEEIKKKGSLGSVVETLPVLILPG